MSVSTLVVHVKRLELGCDGIANRIAMEWSQYMVALILQFGKQRVDKMVVVEV